MKPQNTNKCPIIKQKDNMHEMILKIISGMENHLKVQETFPAYILLN